MSNFTYSRDIPAGNLTPAQNRPSMTINTNSADSIWDEDHYGFNDNNGGLHQQVTFPLIHVPPTAPFTPTVFTKNDPYTIPQLFYYTGTEAQSSLQYILGSSSGAQGSVMLLGGIILKWGQKSFSGTSGNVSFSGEGLQSFPHNLFNVMITSSQSVKYFGTTITDANGFGFQASLPNGFFFWIAIGN